VTLLYFAWVRQKVGVSEERIDLPAQVRTVAELAAYLRDRSPAFDDAFSELARLRAAVNQEHAGWEAAVGPCDEVAFFPPVTGG
jgi:molybdopterin synthase sulfur carrier subunit